MTPRAIVGDTDNGRKRRFWKLPIEFIELSRISLWDLNLLFPMVGLVGEPVSRYAKVPETT